MNTIQDWGLSAASILVGLQAVAHEDLGPRFTAFVELACARHLCCQLNGGCVYTSGSLPEDVVMIRARSLDDPNRITSELVIYLNYGIGTAHEA